MMEMRERLQRLSFCFSSLAKEWKIKPMSEKRNRLFLKFRDKGTRPNYFRKFEM